MVKKKIALPARFLSTFNSFSKLAMVCWSAASSKKGSFWSAVSTYSISETSDAALDGDWAAALLDWEWEDERHLEHFVTELETGKSAVEGLCDFWSKRRSENS